MGSSLKDNNFNLPLEVWREFVFSHKDLYTITQALIHPNCPRRVVEEILDYFMSPVLEGSTDNFYKVYSAFNSRNYSDEFLNGMFTKMIQLPNFFKEWELFMLLANAATDDRLTTETINKAIPLLSYGADTISNYRLNHRKHTLLKQLVGNPNTDPDTVIAIRRQFGEITKEDPSKHKIEYIEKPEQRQQGIKDLEDLLTPSACSFNWYRLAKDMGKQVK